MALESKFKTKLVKQFKEEMFPGCKIIHRDPRVEQGAPDLVILYKDRWAALEGKKHEKAAYQPNQELKIREYNEMSFCRVIYPENAEEVLDDLQRSLAPKRKTRYDFCK